MKSIFSLVIIFFIAGIITVNAQAQRRTVEERVKDVMEKMAVLKLDNNQTEKVITVFKETFTSQEKLMQEIRASGSFDREAMMAARTKATDERNEKLKGILSEEQFALFKKDIEATLQPRRGGGGGQRN